MKDEKLHGNYAKIEKPKHIEPLFCTNTLPSNQEQTSNKVPTPPAQNAAFSKKCVDENHK